LSTTQGTLVRSFAYDSKGFLSSEQHPDKGTVNYSSRDKVGNLLTKADALGDVTYTYDGLNRSRTITYDLGTIRVAYDKTGNTISAKAPSTTTTYVYDEIKRLKSKSTTMFGKTYKVEFS
jgi:YD repeat-containing protein